MKFDEFAKKYAKKDLFKKRDVAIINFLSTPTLRVEIEDVITGHVLPPLNILEEHVLIALLRLADNQGVIDLDEIDIDPENLDDAIRPLIGCILEMPVRLDQL